GLGRPVEVQCMLTAVDDDERLIDSGDLIGNFDVVCLWLRAGYERYALERFAESLRVRHKLAVFGQTEAALEARRRERRVGRRAENNAASIVANELVEGSDAGAQHRQRDSLGLVKDDDSVD